MLTSLRLNNGVAMPPIGLGVFQAAPDETAAAVTAALRAGYRHIDTAASYGNEREVGTAVRESGLDREEVFLETKIWISDYGYEATLHGWEKSAGKLGVEYIDLLILHQPLPSDFELTIGAYRALETLLAQGKVRAIGVSNFRPETLRELMDRTSVVPAIHQIELHPYVGQRATEAFDTEHGIVTQAWSPIGGITFYRAADGGRGPMDDPVVTGIAAVHDRTPAQVILRWHFQHGRSAIPKSVNPTRIAANIDIDGFELTVDELAAIDALDTGTRTGDPDQITLTTFDRTIPEA
jgi:diketogulonate reductase-like aldo/keto reductase